MHDSRKGIRVTVLETRSPGALPARISGARRADIANL